MSRSEPEKNPPTKSMDVKREGWITEIRKYKVITPLFGGGAKPQEADEITVVRATEVRGHLRFWWRATRGGQWKGNLTKMKHHEEEIWGSPAEKGKPGPSKIIVRVVAPEKEKVPNKIKQIDSYNDKVEIGEPKSPWGYVAFPLKKNIRQKKPAGSVIEEGLEFTVELKYPEDQKIEIEIEEALWAWETFGGIGARTRRGFGAIQLIEKTRNGKTVGFDKSTRDDVRKSIAGHLGKYVQDSYSWGAGVPHLPLDLARIKVVAEDKSKDSPTTFRESKYAWKFLFDKLKEFRQARKGFGRSYWPEPDAIRRLPGMTTTSKHSKRLDHIDKFPRAQFGLPIVFKFKDGPEADNPPNPPDPPETMLQGAEHDRLASPLILRPIACSDGAVGLAIVLDWKLVNSTEKYSPPNGLILKGVPGHSPSVQSELSPADLSSIRIDSLKGKTNDVLQAFLNYLEK